MNQTQIPRQTIFHCYLVIVASIFILLVPKYASANGYSGIYGFSPSDTRTHKPVATLGIGGEEWQFSISAIFNSEYTKDDFNDTPIPHSNYTDLGRKRVENMMGFDVGKIYRTSDSLAIVLSGGLFFGRTSRIVRSNATGWLWAQDHKSVTVPEVGVGVLLGHKEDKCLFGLDFNSLRGFGFALQVKF